MIWSILKLKTFGGGVMHLSKELTELEKYIKLTNNMSFTVSSLNRKL